MVTENFYLLPWYCSSIFVVQCAGVWLRGYYSTAFILGLLILIDNISLCIMSRSLFKKVRDGQCHCSVCDQLDVGDIKIVFYDVDDSRNAGKACKCNRVLLSKDCWMLSRYCFKCEDLSDNVITDSNRGNFSWYTGTVIAKVLVLIIISLPW